MRKFVLMVLTITLLSCHKEQPIHIANKYDAALAVEGVKTYYLVKTIESNPTNDVSVVLNDLDKRGYKPSSLQETTAFVQENYLKIIPYTDFVACMNTNDESYPTYWTQYTTPVTFLLKSDSISSYLGLVGYYVIAERK